jgi:hypothetical protein
MEALMVATIEKIAAIAVCAVVLLFSIDRPAGAISVELAKKCRELAIKAHPPQPMSAFAQAERNFFGECVKNNGTTQHGEDRNVNPRDRQ